MNRICAYRTSRLLLALLLSAWAAGVARSQTAPPAAAKPAAAVEKPAVNHPASPRVEAPESPDTVVLKVGDKKFTKAEMDALVESLPPQVQRAVAAQGKKPLADQYTLMVILSNQARLHHLDQTPEFLHKLAFQKQQLEAQAAYDEINQAAKVTPEEVQRYYTAHTSDYDEIMLRQFVVRKKAAPSAAGPGLAPEQARARAEAIRKEVTSGTDIKKVMEDFKAPGDVIIEGDARKIQRGNMRPEMEKKAFALKDGEVSETFDFPQAVVFFQVTAHTHLPMKDAAPEIERNLQQQKVKEAMDTLKKNTPLWMDEQYFKGPGAETEAPPTPAPAVKPQPKP